MTTQTNADAAGGKSAPRTKSARCSGCSKKILWIRMKRADGTVGGMMPVDAGWRYGNDQRTLIVLDEDGYGHMIQRASTEVLGREPHWGSCPKRELFKKAATRTRNPSH